MERVEMNPERAIVERVIPSARLRAALLAAALLIAADGAQAAALPATAVLTARVLGLKSDGGKIGCLLFSSEKGFPTDPGAAVQRTWCAIARSAASCAFDAIPAGTYAIACFHDENDNGKLDTGLFGIPKEGTVASNQAKGFMGPPRFDAAKFHFAGKATELRLTMGY
jgi:uncharacterized protein (DUF2141 family)